MKFGTVKELDVPPLEEPLNLHEELESNRKGKVDSKVPPMGWREVEANGDPPSVRRNPVGWKTVFLSPPVGWYTVLTEPRLVLVGPAEETALGPLHRIVGFKDAKEMMCSRSEGNHHGRKNKAGPQERDERNSSLRHYETVSKPK